MPRHGGWRAEERLTPSPPRPPRDREANGREELTRRRGGLGGHFCTKGQKEWLGSGRKVNFETMKTASRTWKAGGKRMCRRDAGGPPAWRLESGKQAKRPMFSAIFHSARTWKPPHRNPRTARSEASAPLPGGRHPAAPWRMAGGRMAHAKFAKAAKGAGGEREGKNLPSGRGGCQRRRESISPAGISNREKANSAFPKSLSEAPMWYTVRPSRIRKRSWTPRHALTAMGGYCAL